MKNEVRWQYLTEKEIIEAFAADIHAGLSENAVSLYTRQIRIQFNMADGEGIGEKYCFCQPV